MVTEEAHQPQVPTPSGSRTAERVEVAPSASAHTTPRDENDIVIYDGAEDVCTICTDPFQPNERVCRLRCRHMFHAGCWDNLMRAANAPGLDRRIRADCPNCRGAGSLIAIWNYVDPNLITQQIAGWEAPNELEASAEHHSVSTPRSVQDHDASSAWYSGEHEGGSGPAETPTVHPGRPAYHVQTRLADGRPALVVDPGSVGNLAGDAWAKTVAQAAARNGQHPSYQKRTRPLKVQGVGNGSQECEYDCTLPVALRQKNGKTVSLGQLVTPTVGGSDLPGLLGLSALKRNRAVLDFNTMELHFCGPGDYELPRGLPPGTDTFQLEVAPSGHLVLPCCEYTAASSSDEHTLTLLTRAPSTSSRTVPPAPTQAPLIPNTLEERAIPPPPSAHAA
jgi:hypothetical protein